LTDSISSIGGLRYLERDGPIFLMRIGWHLTSSPSNTVHPTAMRHDKEGWMWQFSRAEDLEQEGGQVGHLASRQEMPPGFYHCLWKVKANTCLGCSLGEGLRAESEKRGLPKGSRLARCTGRPGMGTWEEGNF
jgi:hypothetical protein